VRVLLNAQGYNAVFGPALNTHRVANGLPPVDNVRDYLLGDHLGIGAAHDLQAPTTESLSAALRTALTPQTRARATAVAGTIRTDGATVAAKLLLDAVSLI
jgi:hypothetical protein